MLKSIFNRLLIKLSRPKNHFNLTDYWRDRARRHGKRSVLNIAHSEDEFEAVTERQKDILFPLLKSELNGSESLLLDFGCGPGRFTHNLAELIEGKAVGVDITPELLEIAPVSGIVSYQCIGADGLPFQESSFDVIWICLVLGGIPDSQIEYCISEIRRVLKPGGLFFCVENTANSPNADYWFFRSQKEYIWLMSFCNPKIVGTYEDMGQTITIFSGNK